MKASILSVGSELVTGKILNTNATYMAKALSKAGVLVSTIEAIADDEKAIFDALHLHLEKNDIVLLTGGLGPTLDDITRETIAKYFGLKLFVLDSLRLSLIERYGLFSSINNQALVIEEAEVLQNPIGTAPGFYLVRGQKKIFILPGVPEEMKYLLEKEVLPRLTADAPFSTSIHMTELIESKVDPTLRQLKEKFPEVIFGIYPKKGLLEISMTSEKSETGKKAVLELEEAFKDYIYEAPSGLIEEAIYLIFKSRGLTLSTAESCTGGLVSSKLTKISGASSFFLGGIVAYDNQIKEKALQVPEEVLLEEGAVSEKTARLMARGALDFFDTDFAISVTGIAGPTGATPEKPVGTVFLGIASKKGLEIAKKLYVYGNRPMVMEGAANALLGFLYHQIKS